VTTAAVIFDCDGVLVDTEGAANAVLAEVLTDAGLPTTAEESMALYMGRSWVSCMAIATERFGRPLPEAELRERYRSGVRAAWARELAPVPGIVAALDAIAARGLPTCVASSGEHERMRFTLGRTGLLPRFDGRLFSATEVARGKPAPDLFLHAARTMGFDRRRRSSSRTPCPGRRPASPPGCGCSASPARARRPTSPRPGRSPFADMARLPERL
jgi:beta-phosphoglucomutase-like phosphatase (HAD superfamily)